MVLTITPPKLFECQGVLPIVRLAKELDIVYVLAACQPVTDGLHIPHYDGALAFEVPGERLPRPQAKAIWAY
jgi:hypothetical protein